MTKPPENEKTVGAGNLSADPILPLHPLKKNSALPSSWIDVDELLQRIDLSDLVESSMHLDYKRGKGEYRGTCPFHGGDNPTSFQVFQAEDGKWGWKCWACGKGGNAIGFVQERENISDFLEAVRWLVDWARIPPEAIGLTPEAGKQMQERKARTDVFDLIAKFAAEQLWSETGVAALAYARSRAFSDDLIRLAGFGFLDGSTKLRNYLEQAGADMVLAHKLGLIRADGRDFTANSDGNQASPTGWLIYSHRPYPNARQMECQICKAQTWHIGEVCLRHEHSLAHLRKVNYLSARALAPVKLKDKSRNLPGVRQLYKAEVPGVRGVILCEGPADAESYRMLGFTAWALCGLGSLPEGDLAELRRRPVVFVALDGDEEGQKKQGVLAQAIGPLAMVMPPIDVPGPKAEEENAQVTASPALWGKDANAWLQAGVPSEQIETQLKLATPWIDLQLEQVSMARPHEMLSLTGELVELLKGLPKELEPLYFQKAQRRLGMNRSELRALMNDYSNADKNGMAGAMPTLAKIKDHILTFLGEPMGNFSAWIIKELILDDGLNLPVVRYTLVGKLATGEPLPAVEVESEEFASLNWISKYWGARPILYIPWSQRHLFVRAMQEVSLAEMERERVFTHTGWAMIDGQRSFLTRSGRISASGYDDTIRVDLDANLRRYALPEPPNDKDRYEAIKASLDFLKLGPLSVTAPLWAAIYAAPLSEVIPLYTVVWVYGSTQSGKSVITHLVLTHFGSSFIEGRKYHAPTDWMSTVTHLEETMFTAKDLPLVIDDFAPQFHSIQESRQMHKAAYRVIRGTGNRSARGRSRKYQQETLIPRGLVISTAELTMPGESTAGRMLYVPIARGDVLPDNGDGPRLTLNQAQQQAEAGAYAQAMSAYLQWLAANWERAADKLKEIYQESLRLMTSRTDVRNRLPDYFATLDAAQKLAIGAFQEMGVLSVHEAGAWIDEVSKALMNVVISQDENIAAESPVRKFIEALNSLLERRKVYLAPRTNSYVYTPPTQADLIGWSDPDDDCLYLDDGACLEHVREYWAKLGENFDTTTDALRRQFNQVQGLLAERGTGRHVQVSKWLAGKTRRALAIDKQTVARMYGVSLQNEPGQSENEQERGGV